MVGAATNGGRLASAVRRIDAAVQMQVLRHGADVRAEAPGADADADADADAAGPALPLAEALADALDEEELVKAVRASELELPVPTLQMLTHLPHSCLAAASSCASESISWCTSNCPVKNRKSGACSAPSRGGQPIASTSHHGALCTSFLVSPPRRRVPLCAAVCLCKVLESVDHRQPLREAFAWRLTTNVSVIKPPRCRRGGSRS